MNPLLPAPIILPLVAGVLLVLLARFRLLTWGVSVVTMASVLALGLLMLVKARDGDIQVQALGNWPAPFGIVLVGDLFSALMVSSTALIGLASLGLTMRTAERWRDRYIYPIFLILVAGINGAFLTGDIFNLYVFFEVILITSYALLAIGGRALQMEAAFKYVVINLLASTFFLIALGLLYGMFGTLNMAQLAVRVGEAGEERLITVVAALFMVAFGVKAAVIPFHFWLPGTYTYIPAGIAAFFAGVLTKVGVYAMVRLFTLVFSHDPGFFQPLLLVIAALSMVLGVLGAAAQKDMRTILSYHIISQIGYMIMGLGIFTAASVAATVFYIIHHMPVKSALFLVAGSVEHLTGTGELRRLGGLARVYPLLAALFLVAALSLAGVPPLSGFWGKLALVQAGLAADHFAIIAVALVVSLLTMFSMVKIWQGVFWGEEIRAGIPRPYLAYLPPILLLAAVTVVIGVGAQALLDLSQVVSAQLMDPTVYINAVLK